MDITRVWTKSQVGWNTKNAKRCTVDRVPKSIFTEGVYWPKSDSHKEKPSSYSGFSLPRRLTAGWRPEKARLQPNNNPRTLLPFYSFGDFLVLHLFISATFWNISLRSAAGTQRFGVRWDTRRGVRVGGLALEEGK